MPRVSLDVHSANMRTCFSFSLIVFLSSVDWSEEGCHDYFEDDWTSLIGTMVTIVEPKNLSDAAECTLWKFYLTTNNTNASYILSDCFQHEVTLQNITIKGKKCEAQRTYDVHISHLRCLLAKATGKNGTKGCEHESVCHLFSKAPPSTTQQPTAVTSQPTSPTVTSALPSTEIVKPSILTTTIAVTEPPRQTTTLPPEGTKDVTHQGNANPYTGCTQDQRNTMLSLLIVACCFAGLLPVAVYVYMQRQINRYKKLLGVHVGTSFASLPMEEMQLPYHRCSTSQRSDSQDDIRQADVHMQ